MGSAVSAMEKATVEGLLTVAKGTGHSISRQDLVDFLFWCKRRGLLTTSGQLFSKDQWKRIGEELWESVQIGQKDSKQLAKTYRSVRSMIEQVHADAEIAAALQDALSGKAETKEKETEELIDFEKIECPPPYNPCEGDAEIIIAPAKKKGPFDDLLTPWDAKQEEAGPSAPSLPQQQMSPVPMEVDVSHSPSVGIEGKKNEHKEWKGGGEESGYEKLAKELKEQKSLMMSL